MLLLPFSCRQHGPRNTPSIAWPNRLPDVHTKAQRSFNMSRIRSRDTLPERQLRLALWRRGFRYRISPKSVPGRPDLVFGPARIAVFVDGCFWHGCHIHYVEPRTDAARWALKYRDNKARDRRVNSSLRRAGWKVLRIWEHEVNSDLPQCIDKIVRAIRTAHAGATNSPAQLGDRKSTR